MRVVVVTIATADRRPRVARQLESLRASRAPEGLPLDVHHVTVLMIGGGRLPLARARNAGAAIARARGAELTVFLDADCIAAPSLVAAYARAALERPRHLLAGAVTYLTEAETRLPLDELARARHPHAARPAPAPGELVDWPAADGREGRYDLFWSLSFAATPDTLARIGGFDERYRGYGGEDTDYAYRAHAAGVDLTWVGGAEAFHQWHPVSSPPVEHLDDILVNGQTFADRWGVWPMTGWLEAFERLGLVRRDATGAWSRVTAEDASPSSRNDRSTP